MYTREITAININPFVSDINKHAVEKSNDSVKKITSK